MEIQKLSDRALAKILNVSQPTITRIRHKLENNGIIQDYTLTPDFREMGFEILAVTFVKMRPDIRMPEVFKEAKKYTEKWPNAIFAATGEGLGMTGMIISFHYDYSDYHRKWNQMRLEWKDFIMDIKNFIVSIKEGEVKRFSLTYLKDVPL